ncbi:MAG TPA: TIM barrel protein [Armatimonadota bacterium]|jgi:sugar phosphate isomerase/epimerase
MIRGGLTSVTFRQLSATHIVDLVQRTELTAIEWGGDIHVPHGDIKTAREVSRMTADAGLSVSSYGSYYTVGDESKVQFGDVLDAAAELGAPCIRVWAGDRGSDSADQAYWDKIVNESRRIGGMAHAAGICVSYEFHLKTLTDTNDSTLKLLKAVNHPAIKTYWQPPVGTDLDYNVSGLKAILPWLTNVHAYELLPDYTRLPLSEGDAEWHMYLEYIKENRQDRFVLLEFVANDDPDAFMADAATLAGWLRSVD